MANKPAEPFNSVSKKRPKLALCEMKTFNLRKSSKDRTVLRICLRCCMFVMSPVFLVSQGFRLCKNVIKQLQGHRTVTLEQH